MKSFVSDAQLKMSPCCLLSFIFLIELGLGSPRGPVELGHPMARAQLR